MELVTAFVNNHQLTAAELPTLLTEVYAAISGFGAPETADTPAALPVEAVDAPRAEPASPLPAPAVSVEESVRDPDFILSLITGEKLKTLKRHLRAHGLSEAEYRERYNLPADYPFVAPSYSQTRRNVAHKMGFGRKMDVAPATSEVLENAAPVPTNAQVRTAQRSKTKPKPTQSAKAEKAQSAAAEPLSAVDRSKPAGTRKRKATTASPSKAAASTDLAVAAPTGRKARTSKQRATSVATPAATPEATNETSIGAMDANGDKAKRAKRGKLSPVYT